MIGQSPAPLAPSVSPVARPRNEASVANPAGNDAMIMKRKDSSEFFASGPFEAAPAKKARLHDSKAGAVLVIPGGTGSQGAALAYAASKSFAEHGREILIPVRGDLDKAASLQIQSDGKGHKLIDLPGVRLVPWKSLKDADGRNMLVVATVPRSGVRDVLDSLPAHAKAIFTYNGGAPDLPEGVPHPEHMPSMIPSWAVLHEKATFGFRPGALIVDQASPVKDDIQRIFGATFPVNPVASGPHAQWTKFAVNVAANSLATLLGIKVMDLRGRIDNEPQLRRLLMGICAEAAMTAARKEGVHFTLGALYAAVLEKIPPKFDHWTSTGAMFRAGSSLTVDRASLSGYAKTALGQEAAPICAALDSSLAQLEEQRGAGPMVDGFYALASVKKIQDKLLSPELLKQADESVARALVAAEAPAAQPVAPVALPAKL